MFGSVEKISADNVEKRLRTDQSLNVIDVRTTEEIKGGKIPGVLHIPLHELPERVNELNKSKEYVCVCRSGSRSAKAAKYLKKNGFKAMNMNGGMMNWKGKLE